MSPYDAGIPLPDVTLIRPRLELLHSLAAAARESLGIDGIVVLVSLGEDPITGKKIRTRTTRFGVGDVDGMVAAAAGLAVEPHRNVFSPWTVLRKDMPDWSRGSASDILAVLALVIDADADAGKAGIPTLPMPAPYVIQSSANNLQPVYPFSRALTALEAKPIAEALRGAVGGDAATKVIAQVWRVAGCLNWPNKSKADAGRPLAPQLVTVAKDWDGELVAPEALHEAARAMAAKRTEQEPKRPRSKAKARIDTGDGPTLAEVKEALGFIDPDEGERDDWLHVLMAIHDQFGDTDDNDDARAMAVEWSRRGDKFREGDAEREWVSFKTGGGIGIGTLFRRAADGGCNLADLHIRHWAGAAAGGGSGAGSAKGGGADGGAAGVEFTDFYSYMPSHLYIFAPTRSLWPATSVNARVRGLRRGSVYIPASNLLDRHRPVEQMTWAPGEPELVRDRLISEGGWIPRPGCAVFNQYRPPTLVPMPGDASPWLDHVRRIYPDDADNLIKWLAHRVQRPGEKINHAILLGGVPGIGKDTLLEPPRRAVGEHNCAEVSPPMLLGRFTGFLKSVILRVSEVHDLGDADRFSLYEHLKVFEAAPPATLRVDEKFLKEYHIPNVCGVVITSNHLTDGIYLNHDDRRHYVAWSEAVEADFDAGYWNRLWGWINGGGDAIVAHYLATLDISDFDPKAPPPKTLAFWAIVDASRAPENAELADAIDKCGTPRVITLEQLKAMGGEIGAWLSDRKNSRSIQHRLEEVGYVAVPNPERKKDGLWIVNGKRMRIYAQRELTIRARIGAAQAHVASQRPKPHGGWKPAT